MKERFGRLIRQLAARVVAPLIESQDENRRKTDRQIQLLLSLDYQHALQSSTLPKFEETGFRTFGEIDEDGKLWFIFSLIGAAHKTLVDIGAAGIDGSNSANLIINHGWTGLLIDANERAVNAIASYYSKCPETRNFPPKALRAWVTAENINPIIAENGYRGEIDLLLVDIDGVDYWIWKAIDCIRPRVVLLEYQAIWGPEKSLTVPYAPAFKAEYYGRFGIYSGASLAAFVKLGREKGYRLVGCNAYGYNAFFLRNDVGQGIIPEVQPEACFEHPFARWAHEELLPKVIDRDWVEV
jgi:hypothetical protein